MFSQLRCPPLWLRVVVPVVFATLAVYSCSGCSNPTAVKWEGQGLTFDQAAQRAVDGFWLDAGPWVRLQPSLAYGQPLFFKWDNAGAQADGLVLLGPPNTYYQPLGPEPAPFRQGPRVFTWDQLNGDVRSCVLSKWPCANPADEITVVCEWWVDHYYCHLDWGACAGWTGDD